MPKSLPQGISKKKAVIAAALALVVGAAASGTAGYGFGRMQAYHEGVVAGRQDLRESLFASGVLPPDVMQGPQETDTLSGVVERIEGDEIVFTIDTASLDPLGEAGLPNVRTAVITSETEIGRLAPPEDPDITPPSDELPEVPPEGAESPGPAPPPEITSRPITLEDIRPGDTIEVFGSGDILMKEHIEAVRVIVFENTENPPATNGDSS